MKWWIRLESWWLAFCLIGMIASVASLVAWAFLAVVAMFFQKGL